jgi:hypothetical protein
VDCHVQTEAAIPLTTPQALDSVTCEVGDDLPFGLELTAPREAGQNLAALAFPPRRGTHDRSAFTRRFAA